MKTKKFNYDLPKHLIAQYPTNTHSWVVKGDSLEEWDPIEVVNFFQETPK